MSTYKAKSARPIQSLAELKEVFSPSSSLHGRIGVEWELLPIDARGRLVSYAGPGGVERLLGRLATGGHAPVTEKGRIIALDLKGGGMIALEPGAQIEIASRPHGRLSGLENFLRRTFEAAQREARSIGFDLCPWGLAPNDGPEETKDVPKARYAILKRHLGRTGDRGRWMMKLSAATQISLDYRDEGHLRGMVDGCLKLMPYLVSATANAPVANGRRSGWISLRAPVWRRTDPKRCGLPAHLFSPDLSYGSLARHALSRAPLFFVRKGRWIAADGRTFREILRRPGKLGAVTMDDWMLHLSALFTDIRIRGYLEIRVLDSLPLPLVMSAAALLKGLLGLPGGFEWANYFTPPAPAATRKELLRAARFGARWCPAMGPSPSQAWPVLFKAAEKGLEAQGESPDFLAPLRKLQMAGRSPADGWRRIRDGWIGPGDAESLE